MKKWILPFFLLLQAGVFAQAVQGGTDTTVHHPFYRNRPWLVGGVSLLGYGGSLAVLSQAWYKNYPRTSFHTFNDIGEWQQMDKMGHAWTAYNTSRLTAGMWQWAGLSHISSVLLGSGSSLLYMLSIEYLDGHSAEWGWSWPDAGADLLGSALYAGQELAWKGQKIQLKFSSHYQQYADPSLHERASELYGSSFQERLLKDYNAQSYWLSFNLRSFFPGMRLPGWLNLAFGYGASGMFGGYDNVVRDKAGNISFDRSDIKRYRRFYLAPDVDLTKIRTRSAFLRTACSVFNSIKFPTPALEFSNSRFRMSGLVF